MTKRPNHSPEPSAGPPPSDELDVLLRSWHEVNAEQAAAGRDRLMARLREERLREKTKARVPGPGEAIAALAHFLRSALVNRYSPVAASLLLVVVLIAILVPGPRGKIHAQDVMMVPDGGRLDALDEEGNILGPCPLKHTDVDVRISGFLTRVRLTQTYHNPYERKIEAVYTFPLSHRAAVDRMTMTIGDRVVEGEVKERELARLMYEAAREQGYVASLLEQERPNIFTQSVANIEPGAEVVVEIGYVEVLQAADGTYTFDFPMVVGPRYISGSPTGSPSIVPAELTPRQGLVLLGPARLTVGAAGDVSALGSLQAGKLERLLDTASPVAYPGDGWWGRGDATGGAGQPALWHRFEAEYCDGSREFGELYTDGTGSINGRWFYADPVSIQGMGTGFEQDTSQVPDASRITPQPVRPPARAGHDIGVSVTIETGGPGIEMLKSELHEIVRRDEARRGDGLPSALTVTLAKKNEIPNRDFVLSWRPTTDVIQEATFTHAEGGPGDRVDGFFTMILQPPGRVADADVPPRELVFVMDTSGSMNGFPIEKSKAVMQRAIDAMREGDTFNVITFSGHTAVLWDKPHPATAANRAEAAAFVASQQGRGGTEMMKAIDAALVQKAPRGEDAPMRIVLFLTDGYVGNDMAIIDAVRRNADTTRVFSFGIGNSVNRYLLEGMARAGRGEVEFVLLDSDADEAVARFAKRVQTPVLTDIGLQFSDELQVTDILPASGSIPDLFDAKPLVIQGRYAQPGAGTVTIRGRTGAGPWERTVNLELPRSEAQHAVIATLWGRAKIDEVLAPHLGALQQGTTPEPVRKEVVSLGEQFRIMSPFTSFVAVEKSRLTIGGKPVLVAVPIELPDGVSWEGIFGGDKDGEATELRVMQVPAVLGPVGAEGGRMYDEAAVQRLKALGYLGQNDNNRMQVGGGGGGGFGSTAGSLGKRERKAPRDAPGKALVGVPALVPASPGDHSFRRDNMKSYFEPEVEVARPPEAAAFEQTVGAMNELADSLEAPGEFEQESPAGPADDAAQKAQRKEAAAGEQPEQIIRRVLDFRLLGLADMTVGDIGPGITLYDGRLLVTVLVTRTDEATRKALAEAGLKIEAVAKSLPIIVGTIDAANLKKLALVEGVRRIEPTRME